MKTVLYYSPADAEPEYIPDEELFLKSWVGLWRFWTDTE